MRSTRNGVILVKEKVCFFAVIESKTWKATIWREIGTIYTYKYAPTLYTHINIRKYLGIQVERKVGRSKNKLNKT